MKKIVTIVWLAFGAIMGLFAQDGTLDPTFTSGTGSANIVRTVTLQSDGKILIGGFFGSYNGTGADRIARLNTDGTLDTGFDTEPGCAGGGVLAIAVQTDGKVLIGGGFTDYNGVSRNRIARLNTDGTLDTGFDPGVGADANVRAIAIQPDGKIIIGGDFLDYNGTVRNRLARLNSDGTLDTSFDPGTGPSSAARTLALQADGKILLGGSFTDYNGTTRRNIARLNTDGTLDTSFDPGTGANGSVRTLFLQADGKSMIGGDLTTYNGTNRNHIARVNSDGSLDTSFDPGTGPDATLQSIVVQTDGKMIIGGSLTNYNGTARTYLARVNADGTLDTSFDPGVGPDGPINSVAVQTDGQLLIVGSFLNYAGTPQGYVSRIINNGTVPLPVTWINVTAFRSGNAQVRVQWKTKGEMNNSHFIVERSRDGKQFEPVGRVAGQGTTDIVQSYFFDDLNASANGSYYRLRQVDKDGTFGFSKQVYVDQAAFQTFVQLYPNPSVEQLNISFAQPQPKVQIAVFSSNGALVARQQHSQTQELVLSVAALPAGTYLLLVTMPTGQQTHRFVKQ